MIVLPETPVRHRKPELLGWQERFPPRRFSERRGRLVSAADFVRAQRPSPRPYPRRLGRSDIRSEGATGGEPIDLGAPSLQFPSLPRAVTGLVKKRPGRFRFMPVSIPRAQRPEITWCGPGLPQPLPEVFRPIPVRKIRGGGNFFRPDTAFPPGCSWKYCKTTSLHYQKKPRSRDSPLLVGQRRLGRLLQRKLVRGANDLRCGLPVKERESKEKAREYGVNILRNYATLPGAKGSPCWNSSAAPALSARP